MREFEEADEGGGRSEETDDADEADPTGLADEELQDASEQDAEESPEDGGVQAEVAGEDAEAVGSFGQPVELVYDADASAGEGGEGCSGDAHARDGAEAEDEDGVEDVRDPEKTHRDGGVAGAARDHIHTGWPHNTA